MEQKKYLYEFQGLRAIAFLCIFISHLFKINALGAWGASVFLMLSGFLMTYNYMDRTDMDKFGVPFAARKTLPLYRLHILILLAYVAAALLGFYHGFSGTKNLALKAALHAGLVQTWVPYMPYYYSLNDVSWYLCACAFAYACFGPVIRHLRRVENRTRIVLYLIGIICLQFCVAVFAHLFLNQDASVLFSVHWLTYICPAIRFLEFLSGCCLGWIYLNRRPKQRRYAYALIDICAVGLTVLAWIIYTYKIWPLGIQSMKYAFLFAVPVMLLLYAISLDGFLNKILQAKILVRIGDISPYGFLIHGAMISCCKYFLGLAGISGIWAVAACSVIATFILSVLWKFISRKR